MMSFNSTMEEEMERGKFSSRCTMSTSVLLILLFVITFVFLLTSLPSPCQASITITEDTTYEDQTVEINESMIVRECWAIARAVMLRIEVTTMLRSRRIRLVSPGGVPLVKHRATPTLPD